MYTNIAKLHITRSLKISLNKVNHQSLHECLLEEFIFFIRHTRRLRYQGKSSAQLKITVTLQFKYVFNALLFQVHLWCPQQDL